MIFNRWMCLRSRSCKEGGLPVHPILLSTLPNVEWHTTCRRWASTHWRAKRALSPTGATNGSVSYWGQPEQQARNLQQWSSYSCFCIAAYFWWARTCGQFRRKQPISKDESLGKKGSILAGQVCDLRWLCLGSRLGMSCAELLWSRGLKDQTKVLSSL